MKKQKGDGWCHDCQLKRGGVVSKMYENGGNTVCEGICNECGERTTIVPSCDYDWPKYGKKAVWD